MYSSSTRLGQISAVTSIGYFAGPLIGGALLVRNAESLLQPTLLAAGLLVAASMLVLVSVHDGGKMGTDGAASGGPKKAVPRHNDDTLLSRELGAYGGWQLVSLGVGHFVVGYTVRLAGAAESVVGPLQSYAMLIQIFCSTAVVPFLSSHLSNGLLVTASLCAYGASLMMFTVAKLTSMPALFFVAFSCTIVSNSVAVPTYSAWIIQQHSSVSSTLARMGVLESVGRLLGPLLLGKLAEVTTPQTAFSYVTLIILFGVAAVALSSRKSTHSKQQ
jgi:predicted MFS family arabinose efflux permease